MMKAQRKHHLLRNLGIALGSVVLLVTVWWQICLQPLRKLSVPQHDVPTLFIPGYLGNWISLGPMVHRLNHYDIAKEAMVVHIAKDNHITIKQEHAFKDNPNILVLFQDNTDVAKQAYQLGLLNEKLYRDYHVRQINLVGHSAGGNIVFRYLITKHSRPVPQPLKFVNFADDYSRREDAETARLPHNLKVLTVAGEIWHTGTDGEIPLKAALAFSKVLKPHVAAVKTVVFHGGPLRTYHSCLHQNPAVDCVIARFLYDNGN